MSASHSRGPWTLQPLTGSPNGNIGIRASGEHVSGYVAFVDTRWPHPDQQEEQLANARLIAAAPDLLDAADALMAMIDPDGESTDVWCRDMRAALAKGKGTAQSTDAKLDALRAALG